MGSSGPCSSVNLQPSLLLPHHPLLAGPPLFWLFLLFVTHSNVQAGGFIPVPTCPSLNLTLNVSLVPRLRRFKPRSDGAQLLPFPSSSLRTYLLVGVCPSRTLSPCGLAPVSPQDLKLGLGPDGACENWPWAEGVQVLEGDCLPPLCRWPGYWNLRSPAITPPISLLSSLVSISLPSWP